MKRALCLLLAFAMLLSLAARGMKTEARETPREPDVDKASAVSIPGPRAAS